MGRYLKRVMWLLLILCTLVACQGGVEEPQVLDTTGANLKVESSAFQAGEDIPARYTCDGDDVSPPLSWSEPPAGTQSLALICDDPDAPAGTWTHWVLFNLPATARSLSEGIPPDGVVEGVGAHGSNSWGRLGYGGPCPPGGAAHRYLFKLVALDTRLDLPAGASKEDLERSMEGHIRAEGQLTGSYGR
jgi:Raf kinase inhibitor-like YbhB/YbcL family protein